MNKNKIFSTWWWATILLVAVSLVGAAQQSKIKKVMLFEKAPSHNDSRRVLKVALQELAEEYNFELVSTEDHNQFNLDNLKTFQVVIWSNNDGGDARVPPGQLQNDFQTYVEEGGGYIAVHAATAFLQDWPWLHYMVVQPYYHHNAGGTFAKVDLSPDVEGYPDLEKILEGLPEPGNISDEWYAYRGNPRDVNQAITEDGRNIPNEWRTDDYGTFGQNGDKNIVLMTLDESSYNPVTRMGHHPIAWAHRAKEGRVLVNTMGHDNDIYTQANDFGKKFLMRSIQWAAGDFEPVAVVAGCTDAEAENFNPEATEDDESCTYAPCCWDERATNYKDDCKNSLMETCEYAPCCGDPDYDEYDFYCNNHQEDQCITVPVSRLTMKKAIEISPNLVTVDLKNTSHFIQVTNVSGEIVFSETSSGARTYTLNELEAGIYVVKVTASGLNRSARIIRF